jgi:ribonuclease P protein component
MRAALKFAMRVEGDGRVSDGFEHEAPPSVTTPPKQKAFSKDVRLRNQAQLSYVRQRGRKFVGRYCLIQVLSPEDGGRRIGIVNSRRFSKKAVVRNRARRLFREAYRQMLPDLSPAWILIVPRKAVLQVKMPVVYQDLRRLCEEAGIVVSGEARSGCEAGF